MHRRVPVLVAGFVCTLAYGYLALVSTGYGVATLAQMLWVCGVALLATLAIFCLSRRGAVCLTWWDVFAFALVFRLLGVWAYPVLEDDFFRYLWDGWQTVSRGSPYGIPPAHFFAVDNIVEPWSGILDGINYPDVATVYGPTAQWLFALSYHMAPAEVWPLQVLAAAADIGVILVLKRLAPLRWVLMYAWSPLMIKEFAFTAHMDVVGMCLLMGALYLRVGQNAGSNPLPVSVLVGVLLALACGIKVFALLAVPFLLQGDWRGWLVFGLSVVLLALTLGVADAWLPGGLQAMGSDWLFNAPIYYIVGALWGWSALSVAKLVCLLVFSAAAVWVYVRTCGVPELSSQPAVLPGEYLSGMTLLFGLLLFVLPVFNPWYLVWWLALATLRPSFTAWTCTAALFLSYVSGINTGDANLQLYQQPAWVLWLEFGMVGLALVADLWRAGKLSRRVVHEI